MTKKLTFLVCLILVLVAFVVLYKFTSLGLIMKGNFINKDGFLLPILLISSLVDSVNPCAFSILVLTVAFLFNLGKTRRKILEIGGLYIFGIFVVYILIGLGMLKVLSFFSIPHLMAKVGAVIIILSGIINLIGDFFPKFPIKLKIPQAGHRRIAVLVEKASFFSALALGFVVGMFEFPCTGGPYLLVLGLLHDHSTFWSGLGYLIIYNIIFVLPLIIILFISSDPVILNKVSEWKKKEGTNIGLWSAGAMIILGLIIFAL